MALPFFRSTVCLSLALLTLVFAAGCAVRTGPADEAVGSADALLRKSLPSVPEGLLDEMLTPALASGWDMLRGGRYERAADLFTKTISGDPLDDEQRAAANAGLGFALIGLGESGNAGQAFDEALGAVEGYGPARLGRALMLRRAEQWDESLGLYEELCRRYPQSALLRLESDAARLEALQALLRRGEAAARTDPGDAVIIYRQALELDPGLAQLHGLLAGVLEDEGRYGEAIAELEVAVGLSSAGEQVPYRSRLAWLELEHGDPVRAVALFNILLEGEPQSVDFREGLSRAEERSRLEALPGEYRLMLSGSRPLTRAGLATILATTCHWQGRQEPAGGGRPVIIRDIASHWSAEHVRAVVDRGAMEVYQNHTFRPDEAVDRGDLAFAVCRLLNETVPPASDPPGPVLTDISSHHRLYDCVTRLAGAGLLRASEGGRVRVNEAVGAAEALEVVAAAHRLATGDTR